MENFTLYPFDLTKKYEYQLNSICKISNDSIYVSYMLLGNIHEIDLGDTNSMHLRKLKLWEKTCFEFFIKNQIGQYYEFNFSPKFEWNVFYFDKKGDILKELSTPIIPTLDILDSKEKLHLIAKIPITLFEKKFIDDLKTLQFGISAVIKNNNQLDYWALTHKDIRPNFHHFESFIGKF